jgi:hypothetical protein
MGFLRPLLQHTILQLLHDQVGKFLSLERLLGFFHLITDAFIASQQTETNEMKNTWNSSKEGKSFPILPDWFLEGLFDKEHLLQNMESNQDAILLFFVDLMDVVVSTLLTHNQRTQ